MVLATSREGHAEEASLRKREKCEGSRDDDAKGIQDRKKQILSTLRERRQKQASFIERKREKQEASRDGFRKVRETQEMSRDDFPNVREKQEKSRDGFQKVREKQEKSRDSFQKIREKQEKSTDGFRVPKKAALSFSSHTPKKEKQEASRASADPHTNSHSKRKGGSIRQRRKEGEAATDAKKDKPAAEGANAASATTQSAGSSLSTSGTITDRVSSAAHSPKIKASVDVMPTLPATNVKK